MFVCGCVLCASARVCVGASMGASGSDEEVVLKISQRGKITKSCSTARNTLPVADMSTLSTNRMLNERCENEICTDVDHAVPQSRLYSMFLRHAAPEAHAARCAHVANTSGKP